MSSKTGKIVGIILGTALLAGGAPYAAAATKGPVETCVVDAVWSSPNGKLEETVNHCYWDYWNGGNSVEN